MSTAAGENISAADTPLRDPAALELRGRPPRPVRFRRGILIGAAALGATALAGTAWMSLRPPRLARPVEEDIRAAPGAPETVRGLPADYGAVPRLGPPLPGDLGRPILDRQRDLAAQARTPEGDYDPTREAARQRIEALKAARQSGLLYQSHNGLAGSGGGAAASLADVNPVEATRGPDAAPQSDAPLSKVAVAATAAAQSGVDPHRLVPPASPYMLAAGSIIPASLITGLRSDLPGLVIAQVTENIFDSATGRFLLVPQGTRLVGNYDSVVAFGQRRALVVWQRIVLPDGSSLMLDNAPAADASGYAGVADSVDFHSWALLKGVMISTLLGAGTNVSLTGGSDLVQAVRQSAQQNGANAGNQITARNLDIQPTITIRPGLRIRLLVNHDLVLAPWRG